MVNAELSDFYPNNLNILILKGVHKDCKKVYSFQTFVGKKKIL